MSHQVEANTELTDKDLVRESLKNMGWKFSEDGDVFNCGQRYDGTFTIDTKSGKVNYGFENRKEVGDLMMQYQLANVRRQAVIEGQQVTEAVQKVEGGRRYLEITVVG